METIRGKRIIRMLFIYWVVLLLMQALETMVGISANNILMKLALIGYMTSVYLQNGSNKVNKKSIICFFIIALAFILTFAGDGNITPEIFVAYLFPCLYIFFAYCIGSNITISRLDYSFFLDGIIITIYFMMLYCVIFSPEKLLNFLSVRNAYESDLTSFFVSNHEYGMYLIFGIVACFLQMTTGLGRFPKIVYIVSFLVMFLNVILTFSRTSLVAFFGFAIIAVLFSKNRKIQLLIPLFVVVVIYVIRSESLLKFFLDIVIRADNDSGRLDIWKNAASIFIDASIWNKIFGYGIGTGRYRMNANVGHQSHNAYLQILITQGALTLGYMICFLISSLKTRISLLRVNRIYGTFFMGMVISAILFMTTNTAIIFYSPIDSMMMTTFLIVIPQYVMNGLRCERNR